MLSGEPRKNFFELPILRPGRVPKNEYAPRIYIFFCEQIIEQHVRQQMMNGGN
jgi:hypothetical protein